MITMPISAAHDTAEKASQFGVSPAKFFLLTFCASWLIWIPLVLSHFGIAFRIPESISGIVRLLGVLMPAISAIVLTAASGRKGAVRQLLARLGLWRVHWWWWVAAALVFPAILIISALIDRLIGQPTISVLPQTISALLVNIIENGGWRPLA